MAHDLGTNFDEFFPQAGQRPVLDCLRQGQCPHEVGEIVGQRMKLKTHGVVPIMTFLFCSFQHHITIDCFTRPKREDSALTNAAPYHLVPQAELSRPLTLIELARLAKQSDGTGQFARCRSRNQRSYHTEQLVLAPDSDSCFAFLKLDRLRAVPNGEQYIAGNVGTPPWTNAFPQLA